MKKILISILFLPVCSVGFSQENLKTENLFLITVDGLRWQEVYTGADSLLIGHEEYVRNSDQLIEKFWNNDPMIRRSKLLPFFWETIAENGQLYGNRDLGNKIDLANPYRFSYPGYSELLAGYADSGVDSNEKRWNPNKTVLEYINNQPGFKDKVAVFASWDVFPYIVNSQRSGIPVNAGFALADEGHLSEREQLLNEIQPQIPRPWSSVRHNAFSYHYAVEFIKKHQPRVVYISFDETDEFAHSGNYEGYLNSAWQVDRFIAELWEKIQADPHYRDKTTFVIATDHGRGTYPLDQWRHHGADIEGAEEVWLAVIGPDTPALGVIGSGGILYQNQIAQTIAALLGLKFESENPLGEAIQSVLADK